jgi:outer membrane protein assembly factor BamB
MKTTILSILGITAALPLTGIAEDSAWHHWRGPQATGVVSKGNPPMAWSEDTNVKWKVAVPGAGHATPIIVGDKMFLLAASGTGNKVEVKQPEPPQEEQGNNQRRRGRGRGQKPDEVHQFSVICLDRQSGKTLWSKSVKEALPHEGHHRDHGYASCSPVSDGTHLYAFFGSRGLFCLDLEGDVRTAAGFGEGISPVLVDDKIIVKWDHEGDSFIVALDKKTGKEIWKKDRDEGTSWASPVAIEHGGKTQVIASATNKVAAYDPNNGDIIWESTGMTRNVIPTPVWGDGVVYVTSGFRGSALQAIKLDSKGKVQDTDSILWSHDEGTPYVPSPLLYQNRLYFFQGNDNRLSCLDAKTGKVHYSRQRVEGLRGVYASPIGAGDHIYLVGRKGNVVVIKSSDTLEVVSTNTLDEEFDASPVVIGDHLYLRGKQHLYCLAGADAPQADATPPAEEQVVAKEETKPAEPAAVASSKVAGAWSWTAQGFGGQEYEAKLTLNQEEATITGMLKGGFGEDAIESGKLEGDKISFKTNRQFGDNEFTTTYSGKVDGDKITGTIESPGRDGDTRKSDWLAYKDPDINPRGLWKWSSAGRNGDQRDNWVKLAYAKGKLTGVYRSTRSQAPLKEAQLKDNQISFKVERTFGTRTTTTTYKGTVSKEGIKGTYAFRRGDEGQSAEWSATRDTPVIDAVGSWTWTSRFGRDGEETKNTIALKKEGEALTGSVTGRFGDSPIKAAKLDGDWLSFEVTMENDNGSFTSAYTGRIDEDILSGNIATEFGERTFERPFKAARVLPKAEPVGTWKWTSRGRGGDETTNSLTLAQTDGKLTGTYARGDDETAIQDAKLDKNQLTFQLTRSFGGNDVTLNYTGQVRGDILKGHYSFGENSSGWVTLWEAKREAASKDN